MSSSSRVLLRVVYLKKSLKIREAAINSTNLFGNRIPTAELKFHWVRQATTSNN